ncbi:hypothetical protein DV735_g1948, partial [Chaetothyriales sp. CBS 134920]
MHTPANQELQALLKELNEQAEVDREQRIQSKRTGELPNAVPLPDDISPDSLYPTTIHCRSAFDYAFFCQSFGGQFVNVYRYGSFRSCSNHWEDFWLCLRTRNWDEKDRAKAIREHYRKKAVKYKTGPSSEDVWEVRTEPVKDAFQDSLEDLEAKIEQWKKANPGLADPWKGNVTTVMQRAPGRPMNDVKTIEQKANQKKIEENQANAGSNTPPAFDHNAVARIENSRATHNKFPLVKFRNVTNNAAIPYFPKTITALSRMSEAHIDVVLAALSLPTDGDPEAKQKRLQAYIGAPTVNMA